MFPKRPKPVKDEDEEDLLRAQQEFLSLKKAGKIQPSVSNIVKTYQDGEKSKEKINPEKPVETDGSLTFDVNCLSTIGELPIIEHESSNFSGFSFPKMVKMPFPKPARRVEASTSRSLPVTSNKHQAESEAYQKQNDQIIANMSKEQINAMRDEIISKLKPEQIEFLKNRHKGQNSKSVNPNKLITEKRESQEKMEIDEHIPTSKDVESDLPIPLTVIKEHNWLHMNVIEEDKLEWCRPVNKEESGSTANNARFDFSGKVIMDQENTSTKEGLHHHGDEPDKAGYSLPEIFTFIQSSFDSQRIIGLKILARIMDKTHKGFYDKFFNTILAQEILDNSEVILSIRKSLDDNSESVIREAILCLHALICNNLVDESCLDRFFPVTLHHSNFIFLTPKLPDKNIDFSEMKDNQLVKVDVIKGLIRFDLLPRLRYLLDNNIKHKQDTTIVTKIMEILIRISRHSPETGKAIVDCPYLIETIVTNFIPSKIDFANQSIYGNPFPKALKLIRLLLSDTSNCIKIMNAHIGIWDALQLYLTLDPDCFREEATSLKRINILQITIETLRIWCILLSNHEIDTAKNCFNQIYPIIYKQLQYCCTLTSTNHKFDFQYAATLVKCLTWAALDDTKFSQGYGSLIQSILFQSVRDIIDINMVPPFDTLMMMTTCTEFLIKINCAPTTLVINLLIPLLENDKIMKIIGSRLLRSSFIVRLKSFENGINRDAQCLPSFGTIYFGGNEIRFVDLAQDDSVVFFMESLLGAAEYTKNTQLISKIILNQHIGHYIDSIISNGLSQEESIFTQIEFTFIYQICVSSLKVMLNEQQLFYNLALISVYHLKDYQMKENLLNLIIFNSSILVKLIDCDSDVSIKSIDQIKTIFFNYSNFESNLWIFDPIVNNFLNKETPNDQINHLTGTLQFIYFLMKTNYQLLKSMIPQETLFCLIATIYLIDGRQFAEDSISNFLRSCLPILDSDNLIITNPQQKLPHISTISHFYDLFVKQFESESFGDSIFINYLLVFLKSKSHHDFKRKLFSDYSVSLRFLTLNSPSDLIVKLDKLLYPYLNDLTIIELFLSSLLSKQIPSSKKNIIYLIAVHHVHHILFNQQVNSSLQLTSKEDNERLQKYHLSITKCNNQTLSNHLTHFMTSDLVNHNDWAKYWIPLPNSNQN